MALVLVTGAFGLVGKQTIEQLSRLGHDVVASDLRTPENERAARRLCGGVTVRWADLTDPDQVDRLVEDSAPSAIVHLAAVIPPVCYERADLARRVNIGATEALVAAAERLPSPPRFIQASSVAVYGSRNPHRAGVLTVESPVKPVDSYGSMKLAAEKIVQESSLPWLVLRLGAVVSSNLRSLPLNADTLFLEWALPVDGRITTVDVRDVATAFATAATAEETGEILLIGGDDSHRRLQGEMGPALVAAMGLAGVYPEGRPGNPDDDFGWFVCDWMDTRRAQEVLGFQNHSWPQVLEEIRGSVGGWRYLLAAVAPIARKVLARRTPYRDSAPGYADPWSLFRARWPGATPD
ncbi:NAD(P)-dependent oxidoreductase [Mycobacterium sp. SMC-4]|uniref:NAD-dependent epimerase/dehydratase family protein n=1 Tax=Mycobacterium sp. SMC-4 TaxID=2857059 RepID=UPI0021B3609A|nr:NAD-dependent epimerase/dehydratase family protein [Mycobacterium sp. SMC-4]UXA20090.1 NAD-dependent epimerase/dehydratase family protein [Mycobacterium sp. SMC-4]